MKIFVTGGTGFIGRLLIEKLIHTGHNILVLSRHKFHYSKNSTLNYILADLAADHYDFSQLVAFKPDVTIHLAWEDIPDFTESTSNRIFSPQ